MPTKRGTKSRNEITSLFRRDPEMGFSWSVVGEIRRGLTVMGGGLESALEILDDGDFLETLAWGLGKESIPGNIVKAAKQRDLRRRLPIPEEVTAALRAAFPGKVRKKSRSTSGAA